MKFTNIALIFSLSISSVSVFAADSTQHSGKASKHSVLAVGHGAVSTTKVASAVVAVPIVAVGSVALVAGTASVHTGASVADSASHHNAKPHHHRKESHRPLVITETTITADPAPNQTIVIQQQQKVVHTH